MVKAVDNGAVRATLTLNYANAGITAKYNSLKITEMVAAAVSRLRHDLEAYEPSKHAFAYALAGETHAALLQKWSQYPQAAQAALLTALLDQASELLQQLQGRIARVVPTNGYMYGLQDEAVKLEAQADIALEEITRIETALHALAAGKSLQ